MHNHILEIFVNVTGKQRTVGSNSCQQVVKVIKWNLDLWVRLPPVQITGSAAHVPPILYMAFYSYQCLPISVAETQSVPSSLSPGLPASLKRTSSFPSS